jgi:hypothetical protein
MAGTEPSTPAFLKLQKSLSPYIKERQDRARIQRLLTLQLHNHIETPAIKEEPLRPLLIPEISSNVLTPGSHVRGLRREYLKSLRANTKARREFSQLASEMSDGVSISASVLQEGSSIIPGYGTEPSVDQSPLVDYIDLLRQRQGLDRLHVLQDYLDRVGRSPAGNPAYLQSTEMTKLLQPLPTLASDIMMNSSISEGGQTKTDLKSLVNNLEKSVLRAKALLNSEKRLLADLRSHGYLQSQEASMLSEGKGGRLQALNRARDELIGWVEGELGKTSDESSVIDSTTSSSPKPAGSAAEILPHVQATYTQYNEARQALIVSVLDGPDTSTFVPSHQELAVAPAVTVQESIKTSNRLVFPVLKDLLVVASDQKALIQQRSHCSSIVSKQQKEAAQALDRLADESHLLPEHPMPDARRPRRGPESTTSFGQVIAAESKAGQSRRPRAWVYAAQNASTLVKEMVLEKVEEGSAAIEDSRQSLDNLHEIIGYSGENIDDKDEESEYSGRRRNIWTTLDGALGVIKKDEE